MTAPTHTARWRQRVDVLRRTRGGTQLLLALDGDEPVVLEGTGAHIWACLAVPQRVTDLVATFVDVPQPDPQQVADDIAVFLEQLEADHLVERV